MDRNGEHQFGYKIVEFRNFTAGFGGGACGCYKIILLTCQMSSTFLGGCSSLLLLTSGGYTGSILAALS